MDGRLQAILSLPVEQSAKKLLGCYLVRQIDKQTIRVRIVEVEAYDQSDEASHAYGGKSQRNETMFGPSGHLYVYFTYGMHYCCNIVTGQDGYGSGVLIRAVQPIDGIELIEKRRGLTGVATTNGPAKLCQALDIDLSMKGHDLSDPPLQLVYGELRPAESVQSSPRVGISKARHALRRFYIANNPYVSKARFPKAQQAASLK